MRVLVTGGAGFIGSHLVEHLLGGDHRVVVVDNLSSASSQNLKPHPNLRFLLKNAAECMPRELGDSFDGLVHLAGTASVVQSWNTPEETHENNLSLMLKVIQVCTALRIPRFVFASSAAVYGNAEHVPVTETDRAEPDSPYALHKLASEQYGRIFARQHDFEFIALRLFNVYGPRQSPSSPYSGVISKFAAAAATGEPITIRGDGHQSRDFVYVKDVVAAFARALVYPSLGSCLICNIGTGRSTTLLALQKELANLFPNWKGETRFTYPAAGDIRHSRADISRARKQLAYNPRFSLKQGLSDWFEHARTVPVG